MGINFGHKLFSEPVAIESLQPVSGPCLYVILVSDVSCRPKPYKPLYFGQSEGISVEELKSQEGFDSLVKIAGGLRNLYVGVFETTDSTVQQRIELKSELIAYYKLSPIAAVSS